MNEERLAQLRDLADSLAECRSFLAASSRDLKELLAYVDQLVRERDEAKSAVLTLAAGFGLPTEDDQ